MARLIKEGLDYFPLDVDIDQDDKVAIIEARHGITGFGVVIKLLMLIYKNSYYYKWTEREQLLFSNRVNVDINTINIIVNDCIKWGMFDETLFNKYRILTSKGTQSRYIEATSRRKKVEIFKEWLLVDIPTDEEKYQNVVIVNINTVNANNNTYLEVVNADIGTQSKVKESKGKEIKQDNRDNLKTIYKGNGVVVKRQINEEVEKMNELLGIKSPSEEYFSSFVDKKEEPEPEPNPNTVLIEYMNIMDPVPTKAQMDQLDQWQERDGLEPEVLIAAMHTAVDNGKRSFSYLRGIVKNLIGDGVKTMAQYQKREEEYQGRAKKGGTASGTSTNRDNYDTAEAGESDYDTAFSLTYPKIAGGGE